MLRETEFARKTPAGLEIRPAAIRIRWELTELATADGHLARGTFAASVRALPENNQLRMLEEALLGSRSVATLADVAAYFAEAIVSTARKYTADVDCQSVLSEEGRKALAAALFDAANETAFDCGLEVLQPAQVELDCPTLQRQRLEAMDRQAAERRAADQVDQLRRSAELFKQFESLRAAAPELSAGQVLNRIGTTDQADVFGTMLVAAARNDAHSRLWAVAGNSLVRIDVDDTAKTQLLIVPDKLGPIRSVRGDGNGQLLLGCQAGVIRINPESPESAVEYRDPYVNSRLGFNAAVLIADRIWAAHGEAGLVCWTIDAPQKPSFTIRPSDARFRDLAPRNLSALDADRVILSSAGKLLVGSSDGTIKVIGDLSGADILTIHVRPDRALTVHADGQICSWTVNDNDFKLDCTQRKSGRTAAAAILPWMDDARLLLAAEGGPVVCMGIDDELLTQFTSGYPGLRIISASPSAVAGVTADRQRIVLWRPWDGRKPFAELFIFGLAKHRVADIHFA
jgi:hypothetical protein